jgi:hypothetical protein
MVNPEKVVSADMMKYVTRGEKDLPFHRHHAGLKVTV